MKPIPGPYEAWTPGRTFVGQGRNFTQFCEIDSGHDYETRAATARLFAAAPEMLAALKGVLARCCGEYPDHPETLAVMAAIKKVEGA